MRRKKKRSAYIGIGSNLGDRKANIRMAFELVKLVKGVKFVRAASVYETEPEGDPSQGKYFNSVFKVDTTLGPLELLWELQKIEKHLGRKRKLKNGPRTIDLDILLFGDEKVNKKNLTIPHPRMHKREFVLRGLRELTGTARC